MKKLFSLCLLLTIAITVFAEKYKIIKLSTPTIIIGGKTLKVGSEFDDGETISWSSDDQGFWARNMVKGTYNYFAASAFKTRKSKTAFEYLRTNKMSTRNGGFDMVVERAPGCPITEKRIALVIGNANYKAERNLSTPIPDAISVSKKLSELGFNVYVVFDANIEMMNDAIKIFSGYATNYETALVYYAGHGTQFNNDVYLKPVDAVVETTYDVVKKEKWIATKRIVSFLNDVRTLKTRLVLIDACRTSDNLLASRGESEETILDTDELREGVILYSTKYGYEAYDEDGQTTDHSPFASAVIKHISTPNISVSDFITDVMNEVKMLTSVPPYPHSQEPRSVPTLTHRFYFNPVQEEQNEVSIISRLSERDGIESGNEIKTTVFDNPTTPEGFYETGMSYYQQKDFTKAVNWFIKSASSKYAPAQAMLGVCYLEGEGVQKDYGIARDYFEKAEKKNNGKAINGLGILYASGLGVEKNIKKAIKYYERAAKLGYGAGYYNLGYLYYEGVEVEKDLGKAIEMFKAGADINHPRSTGMMGFIYELGYGTPVDMEKAIDYFNKGVELGDENSAYSLALLYRDGTYVAKNPEQAAKLFAKDSSVYSLYELAICYRDGFGVEKNEKQAAVLFEKAAEQGHILAQYETGQCYFYGTGVDKNEKQAVIWYEKAALQGNAFAQNSLGYCYLNGLGVEKNNDLAFTWFKKSADQGNSSAQDNLGLCYENGWGVEKNQDEAIKWFYKSAEQEFSHSQYHLGLCYEYGDGPEKNMEEAAKWYAKAADQGHAKAQFRLGVCYEHGDGVETDIEKAIKWYVAAAMQDYPEAQNKLAYFFYQEENYEQAFIWWEKSAKQGNASAQFNLGVCYENGKGVNMNKVRALEWYVKAADQNHEKAINAKKRLMGK